MLTEAKTKSRLQPQGVLNMDVHLFFAFFILRQIVSIVYCELGRFSSQYPERLAWHPKQAKALAKLGHIVADTLSA